MHEDGQKVTLSDIESPFEDFPRTIVRDGETGAMAIWYMPEDGSSPQPGKSIVNVPTKSKKADSGTDAPAEDPPAA
jgi:hypothetical protein